MRDFKKLVRLYVEFDACLDELIECYEIGVTDYDILQMKKSLVCHVFDKAIKASDNTYLQGAKDVIDAIVLDEKDLPKGFEKVKSVQMKKAKEFLKDL